MPRLQGEGSTVARSARRWRFGGSLRRTPFSGQNQSDKGELPVPLPPPPPPPLPPPPQLLMPPELLTPPPLPPLLLMPAAMLALAAVVVVVLVVASEEAGLEAKKNPAGPPW